MNRDVERAVAAAKAKAREWNESDPDSFIHPDAVRQMVEAALEVEGGAPVPPARPDSAPVADMILRLTQEEAREELRREASAGMAPVQRQIHAWALLDALEELERRREEAQVDGDLIDMVRSARDRHDDGVRHTGDREGFGVKFADEVRKGLEIYERAARA